MSSPNWWGDWRPTLTPHTGNLQATDLIECTSIVGGLPVNTAITGAQIIAAASGGSGLTIGTTGITSGTIGRVLFQGTGNVLQQSTNLFWDNTNNRLGVGTSSPIAFIHSQGSVTASSGIARGNYLNNTLVAAANNNLLIALDIQPTFTNSGFSGVSNIGIRVNGEFLVSNGKAFTTTSGAAANTGGFSSGQFFATGTNLSSGNVTLQTFYAGVGYSTPFLINPSGGNVIIGSSTNAGYKLDVNGTARVQTSLAVTTGKTFSAYTSSAANDALKLEVSNLGAVFGVQNSNASGFSGIEYLSNAGVPRVFTGFNNGNGQEFRFNNFASGGYIDFLISSTSGLRIANTRNILINTTTDAGFRLDVNGTARIQSKLSVGTPTAASAVMEVTSTTQGFLPPRMTNAQMLAIATPAAGLIVYDTTNNKHCGYNGTAWQNFY